MSTIKSADNVIKRGSTNKNIFKLPDAVPLDTVQKVLVLYFQNRSIVVEKETAAVTIDAEKHTLSTELTEAETLKFSAGIAELEVCIKYQDGHTLRSHIYKIMIEDTLLNQEV
nr:MAG TPA_asm: hypothetical protein [Caudoviricetes sp.]